MVYYVSAAILAILLPGVIGAAILNFRNQRAEIRQRYVRREIKPQPVARPASKPPPPLPGSVSAVVGNSFASEASMFSVVAPILSIAIVVFLRPLLGGYELPLLLAAGAGIFLGQVLGILSLFAVDPRVQRAVFIRAIVGCCLSGVVTVMTLVAIPQLSLRRQGGMGSALPAAEVVSSVAASNSTDGVSLSELLPVSDLYVDLYELRNSAPMTELAIKVFQHPDRNWWREYLQNAGSGPLPYHTNFGVSEAEYREFLGMTNDFYLAKAAVFPIKVARSGRLVSISFKEWPYIQPLLFNVAEQTVRTPLAQMTPTTGKLNSPGGLLGENFSYKWTSSAGGITDCTNITVSVGRILASGRKFIHYEVFANKEDEPAIRFETIFQY